jgi:Na+/H+-dicarboxylate symporter
MTVLLKRIVSPLIIAFGTTSEAVLKLTEELERFGIKDRIVSFMLPWIFFQFRRKYDVHDFLQVFSLPSVM